MITSMEYHRIFMQFLRCRSFWSLRRLFNTGDQTGLKWLGEGGHCHAVLRSAFFFFGVFIHLEKANHVLSSKKSSAAIVRQEVITNLLGYHRPHYWPFHLWGQLVISFNFWRSWLISFQMICFRCGFFWRRQEVSCPLSRTIRMWVELKDSRIVTTHIYMTILWDFCVWWMFCDWYLGFWCFSYFHCHLFFFLKLILWFQNSDLFCDLSRGRTV